VDTAIRMAKQWQYNRGETKRYKVISRIGSYHGTTYAALSVNNSKGMNKPPSSPSCRHPQGARRPARTTSAGMGDDCETLRGLRPQALIQAEKPAPSPR
jgi:adenosylmethionine-8-amino-7-oxononanoate aminotransferase